MKTLSTALLLFITFSINAQKEPITNYEKLWSKFNERYANFELKSINWQEVYNKYRPKITDNTTQEELFNICCKTVQELNDGHVSIEGKINKAKQYCGINYTYHIDDEFGSIKNLIPLIEKSLDKKRFFPIDNRHGNELMHISVSDDYGYLRIDGMSGYAIGEIKKSMKKAMNVFENKKGIIIDVRLNGGGRDKVSYKIAGRFTKTKRLGHYKKTRIKGTNDYTDLTPWYLKPKGNKQFTKSIIILTSDWSASATEIFLLAMKELPYVTLVGNTTEGIFSDMYFFKLPNGWRVSLSHQQYFSTKMINYEGKGIEPDVKVLNYKKDEYDSILFKAIEILDKKTNK